MRLALVGAFLPARWTRVAHQYTMTEEATT